MNLSAYLFLKCGLAKLKILFLISLIVTKSLSVFFFQWKLWHIGISVAELGFSVKSGRLSSNEKLVFVNWCYKIKHFLIFLNFRHIFINCRRDCNRVFIIQIGCNNKVSNQILPTSTKSKISGVNLFLKGRLSSKIKLLFLKEYYDVSFVENPDTLWGLK